MYRIATLVLFAAISLTGQKRYDLRFTFEGRIRETILVKPSKPAPPGGYPVVFMLHGTSGDGEKFYDISGWKELGEIENFITIFPSSLAWCYVDEKEGVEKHLTRWVNGNVTENPCAGPPQNYVDDVNFLKKLVSIVADTLPINPLKVFASGFSNGCSMIHKLAIDAGDVFAAVAGSSAPLALSDSATPVNRIPVWFMLGNLDDRFFVPNRSEIPYGGDTILAYLHDPLFRAITCQGLDTTYSKKETAITKTYLFTKNLPGVRSKPYVFTLVKGLMHEYPNGINFPLEAAGLFWDFFKQSIVTSTASHDAALTQHPNPVIIYPNPSEYSIKIEIACACKPPFKLKVINALGQVFMENNRIMETQIILDKSNFGRGIFTVHLDLNHQSITRQVVFH